MLQEILVLLLSTISLSCSKQCCYEGTPRSFHIHFSTHWYPIALFLNKRSISRSLASALMVNATESYPLCFSGRGNTSKDALPFFPQIFFFFGGGREQEGTGVCVFSITATLLSYLMACHFSFHKIFSFYFYFFIYLSPFHNSGLQAV